MLTSTSKHMIRALIELGQLPQGKWLGAEAIARRIRSPYEYLAKMLKKLASCGLLVSQRGSGGGFRLAKKSDEITLYDVVQYTESVETWSKCVLGLKKCSNQNPCVVHPQWSLAKNECLRFLKRTTISQLVENLEKERG